uniref:Large ribosomal subunit protein uL6c n=1 Tax=Polysiphonia infestans TaxID=2006978 RepID=A0A1Z1MEK6_9FLOR|nr:ribosomal protein L6 [Polysiphonia infestans]ARW64413.1 ribosomal protein L6 [Polysiphonia infestans]
MSRIGKKEVRIPKNTEIRINQSVIKMIGVKGEISYNIPKEINVSQKENKLVVTKNSKTKQAQALHGLSRSIINNMSIGVSEGFSKKLIIQGVGYRSQMDGKTLILNLGYSHAIRIQSPENITINVDKNTHITISGINKEKVGQVAATIRSTRPPEPYKGKGIRYEHENIRRKVGKAGK